MGQTPDSTEPNKPRPVVGRAAIKTSPVKEWSGGMTEVEANSWELVAQKCREGIKPTMAAAALGLHPALNDLRRKHHPCWDMIAQAWNEGQQKLLSEIRAVESWQAKMTLLERQNPAEFAVDSAIRNQLNMMAGEAGFPVPDLMDAVRIIREAQDSGIDVHTLLRQAIEAQAG